MRRKAQLLAEPTGARAGRAGSGRALRLLIAPRAGEGPAAARDDARDDRHAGAGWWRGDALACALKFRQKKAGRYP